MEASVYFDDIYSAIHTHLQSGNTSLKLAVSWLTDKSLFALLMEKLSQGVSVSIVTRNDYLNNHADALPWNDFIQAGGKLYFSRNGEQLHYKFILANDAAVLCTSYNLTCFANGNNRENAMLFTEAAFVSNFVAEFNYLTSTLAQQTFVQRIALENVAEELHGFYTVTLKSDKEKQSLQDS